MKCDWYEEQLEGEEALLWNHGRPSSELLSHARDCKACGQLVNRELELRELFIALAETSQRAEPSESIRRSLLAEVNVLRATRKPRRTLKLAFALAAAALICAVVGLAFLQKRGSAPAVATEKQAAGPPVEPSPVEPLRVASVAPRPKVRVAAVTHSPQLVSAEKRTANDFYPTVVCDSLTCAGPAIEVRVQMPASPLMRSGAAGGTVTADLLVGEDGVIRGIRVLE